MTIEERIEAANKSKTCKGLSGKSAPLHHRMGVKAGEKPSEDTVLCVKCNHDLTMIEAQ